MRSAPKTPLVVLVRELKHPPAKVWTALTDPDHLREWSPFDSDTNLGTVGAVAKLSTNSRHTVIVGSGHEIHLFQPPAVIQAINDVLESVARKTPLTPR